jgi:5'-deoxynucleotidase YfbR-like HD superfamily hydrolase
MAGELTRFHAWPTLQNQTIAHHSWNVVRILFAIEPEPSMNLVKEAMFHDVGEVGSGDSPGHIKRANPDLRDALERLEHATRLSMCIPWGISPPAYINDEERLILLIADKTDQMEFAMHEMWLGNQFMKLVFERTQILVEDLIDQLPMGIRRSRAKEYISRRLKEWGL